MKHSIVAPGLPSSPPIPGPLPKKGDPLAAKIHDVIALEGPMTFAQFMAEALYHPELGYYSCGKIRIGLGGDFYTSVSIGPLFGQLLARQVAQVWERLGSPNSFQLVEQGASHGELARDILCALRELAPECFAATELYLVEPFSELQARQKATLSEIPNIHWISDLEALPAFRGVHLSNELADAFPVHRVQWKNGHWQELHVQTLGTEFEFTPLAPSSPELEAALTQLPRDLPDGYTTEVSLAASKWIQLLAERLTEGIVLMIDYGYPRAEYYRPERSSGTLTAYARHQKSGQILYAPGAQDLTAHVEFTSLVEAAESAGLKLHGFCDQHHFLVGLSRLHFSDGVPTSAAAEKELRAFKTLMHPSLMGQSFKALCLEKFKTPQPPFAGFQFAAFSREKLGMPRIQPPHQPQL
jgi:SAM-dependent MidA family methyltransferase